MKKIVIMLVGLSILAFGVTLPGIATAAEKGFPNKEITVIVSLAAGGPRDLVARGVSQVMSKYLGVPMVVSNLPGAGGARGIIAIYDAAPDGYTIGLGATTDVIAQILQKQTFDMKKVSNIGRAASTPMVFYVKSDSPIKSFKDFKTFGKPIRYATQSFTGGAAIGSMILASREKVGLRLLGGFKNITEAIYSMLRGEAEFIGSQPAGVLDFVKAGEIRPILTFAPKRLPEYPDTPTVAEIGHKDLDIISLDTWLMGPPEIPKDRLKILEDALMKTLKDPEFLNWAKKVEVNPSPLNADDTNKMVSNLFKTFEPFKGEIEKYTKN